MLLDGNVFAIRRRGLGRSRSGTVLPPAKPDSEVAYRRRLGSLVDPSVAGRLVDSMPLAVSTTSIGMPR